MKFAWQECGAVKSVFFHSKPTAGIPTIDESPFFPTQEAVKVFFAFPNIFVDFLKILILD